MEKRRATESKAQVTLPDISHVGSQRRVAVLRELAVACGLPKESLEGLAVPGLRKAIKEAHGAAVRL